MLVSYLVGKDIIIVLFSHVGVFGNVCFGIVLANMVRRRLLFCFVYFISSSLTGRIRCGGALR